MPEKWVLQQYQALPLTAKIHMSQARIREWYDHWNGDVCVSFSGGKDSTVLVDLVHDLYPDVPIVFVNTGLEYPELQKMANDMNAKFIYPKMSFSEVISTYGYPIISKEISEAIYFARKICNGSNEEKRKTAYRKRSELLGERLFVNDDSCVGRTGWGLQQNGKRSMFNKEKWFQLCKETQFMISHMCCNVMKKRPIKGYLKKNHLYPYVGTLAEESRLREQAWVKHGCNAFDAKRPMSKPLSFWTEQDILQYIKEHNLEIADVYGDIVEKDGCLCTTGANRTGCIWCLFGIRQDSDRLLRLKELEPKRYEFVLGGGEFVDGFWQPNKEGLGYKFVIDWLNEHGNMGIKY